VKICSEPDSEVKCRGIPPAARCAHAPRSLRVPTRSTVDLPRANAFPFPRRSDSAVCPRTSLARLAVESIRLVTFSQDDAVDDLGSQFVVGSVEGHGSNRVAAKSRPEVRVQPRLGQRSLLAESLPSFHQCNILRASRLCSKTSMC
jgi:hypothetical protein